MLKPSVARQILIDGTRGRWVAFNSFAQAFICDDWAEAIKFALRAPHPGTHFGGHYLPPVRDYFIQ